MLSGSLRRMHFSDEESDRLINLEEAEVLAITRQLQPVLQALIIEVADRAIIAGMSKGASVVFDGLKEARQ